jgi:hypothetical protein
MFRTHVGALLVLLLGAFPIAAQNTLPVVAEVEWPPLRTHCRQLLKALDKNRSPLSTQTVEALTALLDRPPNDAALAVQKLLDAHCLLAVEINAESRVKAARGPARVDLRLNRSSRVLIKVQNDGGVTHALRLHGPELLRDGEDEAGPWLEAKLRNEPPFAAELSGRRLEYRLLCLTPRQSGKREATFQFDVGQGTQDLGFRAEVPILFTVRKEADATGR